MLDHPAMLERHRTLSAALTRLRSPIEFEFNLRSLAVIEAICFLPHIVAVVFCMYEKISQATKRKHVAKWNSLEAEIMN